jgi:hypothetical protein
MTIRLKDYQAAILLGYVAELLDDKSLIPDGDREVLDVVYRQLTKGEL